MFQFTRNVGRGGEGGAGGGRNSLDIFFRRPGSQAKSRRAYGLVSKTPIIRVSRHPICRSPRCPGLETAARRSCPIESVPYNYGGLFLFVGPWETGRQPGPWEWRVLFSASPVRRSVLTFPNSRCRANNKQQLITAERGVVFGSCHFSRVCTSRGDVVTQEKGGRIRRSPCFGALSWTPGTPSWAAWRWGEGPAKGSEERTMYVHMYSSPALLLLLLLLV